MYANIIHGRQKNPNYNPNHKNVYVTYVNENVCGTGLSIIYAVFSLYHIMSQISYLNV